MLPSHGESRSTHTSSPRKKTQKHVRVSDCGALQPQAIVEDRDGGPKSPSEWTGGSRFLSRIGSCDCRLSQTRAAPAGLDAVRRRRHVLVLVLVRAESLDDEHLLRGHRAVHRVLRAEASNER